MNTSRFAIAAVATALMGTTAMAADLGGNCCADLEERIAELEATTVRKGNRKVSLAISGYVSHNIIFWDDGTQTDTYIGDGGNYGSRWRFRGEAKINHELTAGFLYEFGINNNSISAANQLNGGDDLGGVSVPGILRDSTVWLRHKRLGMVKIGHGSTATDNLVLIDLGGYNGGATPDVSLFNGGFLLRSNAGLLASATTINWAQAIRGHESWDTSRRNHVLYETPTLHGFSLQAAVAEDNYWDIALRYAGEFNGVRIAFGIGYLEDTEFNAPAQFGAGTVGVLCTTNCDVKVSDWKGSASVLHTPTGLFLTGAWGNREIEGGGYAGPDLRFWWLAGGIAKNFFGIGNTVLFAEYGEHKGGLAQANFLGTSTGHSTVIDSEVTNWGIGILQNIDAAAVDMFLAYKNFELSTNGFTGANTPLNNNTADFSAVVTGVRISF
jgi:hypothetical protein